MCGYSAGWKITRMPVQMKSAHDGPNSLQVCPNKSTPSSAAAMLRAARREAVRKVNSTISTLPFKDISPTGSRFGASIGILFRWRGSIYQLIIRPFLIYWVACIVMALVHDYVLEDYDDVRKSLENIAEQCCKYVSSYRLFALLLGFFTATAIKRWFSVTTSIPGTSKVIASFMLSLKEDVPYGSQMVEHYARWVVLGWVLTFRSVCPPLRKAYPDLVSLQQAGFLREHERLSLEREALFGEKQLPLAVLNWKLALLKRCYRQGHFAYTADCNRLVDGLMAFKKSCGNTLKFARNNIPLALTQVVTITVYSTGVAMLLARNMTVDCNNFPKDGFTDSKWANIFFRLIYLPFFDTFKYFMFYSWLKFGVMARNPFGEDGDDINIRKMLLDHVKVATRLQGLYVSGPTDELVTATIETSGSAVTIDVESSWV